MEQGGLLETAAGLVRARDDEIGAGAQCVRGVARSKGQMAAPRLVDHECGIVLTARCGDAPEVRYGAEVGGRDHQDSADRRICLEHGPNAFGGEAVGDPELIVHFRVDEQDLEPGEHQTVDHASVAVALYEDPSRRRAHRDQRRANGIRCSSQHEPGALRTPCVGGEPLRLLVRGGRATPVHALDQRRDVGRPEVRAGESFEGRTRAAAVMARRVQPHRVGGEMRAKRAQVGRTGVVHLVLGSAKATAS